MSSWFQGGRPTNSVVSNPTLYRTRIHLLFPGCIPCQSLLQFWSSLKQWKNVRKKTLSQPLSNGQMVLSSACNRSWTSVSENQTILRGKSKDSPFVLMLSLNCGVLSPAKMLLFFVVEMTSGWKLLIFKNTYKHNKNIRTKKNPLLSETF